MRKQYDAVISLLDTRDAIKLKNLNPEIESNVLRCTLDQEGTNTLWLRKELNRDLIMEDKQGIIILYNHEDEPDFTVIMLKEKE